MRIHLGHHFYGAGNLGDDFMLAGFLGAMRTLAPDAKFTGSVPFPLDRLKVRFPDIDWRPYTDVARAELIRDCDAWLGLGGSPFQAAQSTWFVEHLTQSLDQCRTYGKPMYFLGIGTQTIDEVTSPVIRRLCSYARRIWTRDPESAKRILAAVPEAAAYAAADIAHCYFHSAPIPAARSHRLVVIPNFDYQNWPGLDAFLAAAGDLAADERIWLAQETRALPGAERALYASLSAARKQSWHLAIPDEPAQSGGTSGSTTHSDGLDQVVRRWPSGEWIVTARYHAALAAAWAGSKIIVIATNEKLRAAATELNAVSLSPSADLETVREAFASSKPAVKPVAQSERAFAACRQFVEAMRAG